MIAELVELSVKVLRERVVRALNGVKAIAVLRTCDYIRVLKSRAFLFTIGVETRNGGGEEDLPHLIIGSVRFSRDHRAHGWTFKGVMRRRSCGSRGERGKGRRHNKWGFKR